MIWMMLALSAAAKPVVCNTRAPASWTEITLVPREAQQRYEDDLAAMELRKPRRILQDLVAIRIRRMTIDAANTGRLVIVFAQDGEAVKREVGRPNVADPGSRGLAWYSSMWANSLVVAPPMDAWDEVRVVDPGLEHPCIADREGDTLKRRGKKTRRGRRTAR